MITRRPLLLGAAAAGLVASSAWAQANGFSGEWFGVLTAAAAQLRLRLVIADGGATLYSLDQGNTVIPAAQTRIEADRIELTFPTINGSYSGRLANGRIEGQFTQGATLPLTFGREPVAAHATPAVEALTQQRLAALRAAAGSPAMGAAASKLNVRSIAFADGLRAIGQPQAVTTSDQWHLGSMTKSMTATLVARAAERGAVSWDDTLGDVLGAAVPTMRDEYRRVTFRHLCSHRSGLPANIELSDLAAFPRYNDDPRQDRILYARLALAQAPLGPAEQTFTYSNSGFIIAGAMLEARMGLKWEDLIREHVFAPLGLSSAGQGAPGTGAYDQPVGHAPGAGGALTPFPVGGPITDNPAVLGPAGRVHMAFEDLLKYLAAHRDRTSFLNAASWQTLHTPPFGGDYAMGWVKRGDTLWHNGTNTLWYAEMMFNSASGVVAAAAVNDGRAGQVGPTVGVALQSAALAVTG